MLFNFVSIKIAIIKTDIFAHSV